MIQMMQGHALTILSEMPRDYLFDAVITDPPYASGAATQSGISAKTSTKYTSSKRGNCPYPDFEGDAMDKRSWANLMLQVLLEARMRTKPGGVIAMFVDWRQTPIASDVMQWAGWTWRGMAQWDKGNCRPQKGASRQKISCGDQTERCPLTGQCPACRGCSPTRMYRAKRDAIRHKNRWS